MNFLHFLTPYDVGCLMGSAKIFRMKIENENQQLELTIPNLCPRSRRPVRNTRASLWFNRMRQLVDSAPDLQPVPRRELLPLPTTDY